MGTGQLQSISRDDGTTVRSLQFTYDGPLPAVYLLATEALQVSPGGFGMAFGYGLLTTALAWCVPFPALGLGFMGRQGPPWMRPARTSLFNHANFGLALWGSWRVW